MIHRFLNTALQTQPAVQAHLKTFSGKTIGLIFNQKTHVFLISSEGFFEPIDAEPLCSFSFKKDQWVALALKQPEAERSIGLSGDLKMASQMGLLLRQLKVNPVEWISLIAGDACAYRVEQAWMHTQETHHRLTRQFNDYWRYEAEILPSPQAVQDWIQEVDTLQESVARFEQRLKRLEQHFIINRE